MSGLPEHVLKNRAKWDAWADEYVAAGERGWAQDAPAWGIWSDCRPYSLQPGLAQVSKDAFYQGSVYIRVYFLKPFY